MADGWQIGQDVAQRQWRIKRRPFASRAHYWAAVKREFDRRHLPAVRAEFDPRGNCTVCWEAGRCPGWHSPAEREKAGVKAAAKPQMEMAL